MTAPPELILASTSRYRRALLERLQVPFRAIAPEAVDEEAAHRVEPDPRKLAMRLAHAKADDVAQRHPDAWVIGSDQVPALLPSPSDPGGAVELLTKPGTEEAAVQQLLRAQGRVMELITAVALVRASTGERRDALSVHTIRFRSLTEAQLREYVRREQPLDCAGAFKLEGLGSAILSSCSGDDFSGVIGLPLMKLAAMLEDAGIPLLS
ncbi:MAG: Maf family protein [Planctomycetota bacterium]